MVAILNNVESGQRVVMAWSYGSWIYNYLYNQCLSPLMLWVRISIRAMCTTVCDNVCKWLATGWWFSPCPPVSSKNKTDLHDITDHHDKTDHHDITDLHDITEILLKVALSTIKQTTNMNQGKTKIYFIMTMTSTNDSCKDRSCLWIRIFNTQLLRNWHTTTTLAALIWIILEYFGSINQVTSKKKSF